MIMTANYCRGRPTAAGPIEYTFYRSGDQCWYVPTLWRAAKNVPIQTMSVTELNLFYDNLIQDGYYEDWDNSDDYRATIADLDYPIIMYVDKEGLCVCDGFHRIVKAIREEVPINYQIIQMPNPDFRVNGTEYSYSDKNSVYFYLKRY